MVEEGARRRSIDRIVLRFDDVEAETVTIAILGIEPAARRSASDASSRPTWSEWRRQAWLVACPIALKACRHENSFRQA